MSDTTSPVSVSSNPVYQLYYTHFLYDMTHYMYDITSVCMTSHEHFKPSHPYRNDITSSVFMTSYPIYIISPTLFHENKTTIPGISPTLLTSQPLHLCCHTRSISAFTTIMEGFRLITRMTSYTCYITPNSDFMKSIPSI